ncbi:MAG: 1-deoxy-D-xylulose-5-phosphate reductoisomerase [Burkholderiales bacterium]|nr:1-deoxy-D-xylulose-5-phosphate reductoisomerase [Burkholderiales bacterium]
MHGVAILGSTGSIGRNTLDVIARHPDRFRAVALSAQRQVDVLFDQCIAHRPDLAAVVDETAATRLRERLAQAGSPTRVVAGGAGLEAVATAEGAQSVMAAIVGAAGLRPALAAATAGKRILLANKEALVMAGAVFMDAVRRGGATLLPIDSEHNAVFQALPRGYAGDLPAAGVRRILLTASGGPFRTLPLEQFAAVTPDQACAHPNWVMGRKISVDSATMMNKGLEVIEAHWLFNAPPSAIEVVIHPQSVVHSMVEYVDGSVIAQLGNPDMRTPIAHALAFPERIESGSTRLELAAVAALSFEAPDPERFPCVGLAYRALEQGGAAPVALNAANEVAVARFLDGGLGFDRIPALVEAVLARTPSAAVHDLDDVLEVDAGARRAAAAWLDKNNAVRAAPAARAGG